MWIGVAKYCHQCGSMATYIFLLIAVISYFVIPILFIKLNEYLYTYWIKNIFIHENNFKITSASEWVYFSLSEKKSLIDMVLTFKWLRPISVITKKTIDLCLLNCFFINPFEQIFSKNIVTKCSRRFYWRVHWKPALFFRELYMTQALLYTHTQCKRESPRRLQNERSAIVESGQLSPVVQHCER